MGEWSLTDDEQVVLDHLCDAYNAFAALDQYHPMTLEEFCHGIHACQGILAVRALHRQTRSPRQPQ